MENLHKGIVVKSTGSWLTVKDEDEQLVQCRLKGGFRQKNIKTTNPVAVGDEVLFFIDPDGTGRIEEIKERKNYIIRRSVNLSKREHILAANLDQAVLFVTLAQPVTYRGFIDRFLVTAEAYHIPAILIFNKTDLYNEEENKEMNELIDLYYKVGYQCYTCNATKQEEVEKLSEIFKGKISLFSGHSGAGKTTFINQLSPDLNLRTAEVSSTHLSGKHTTTFAEMIPLPNDTYIIDSPGIKGLGIIDIPAETLSQYFPEFRAVMDQCKFHNCMHLKEPGCAVKKGLECGEISESRYKSYLTMLEDESDESYRTVDY